MLSSKYVFLCGGEGKGVKASGAETFWQQIWTCSPYMNWKNPSWYEVHALWIQAKELKCKLELGPEMLPWMSLSSGERIIGIDVMVVARSRHRHQNCSSQSAQARVLLWREEALPPAEVDSEIQCLAWWTSEQTHCLWWSSPLPFFESQLEEYGKGGNVVFVTVHLQPVR